MGAEGGRRSRELLYPPPDAQRTMHLTESEFEALCRQFAARHQAFGWRLVEHHDDLEDKTVVYLQKVHTCSAHAAAPSAAPRQALVEAGEELQLEAFGDEDPASRPAASPAPLHTYECHVVYSVPYGVPALYFLAWDEAEGRLLSAEEVAAQVPAHLGAGLDAAARGAFITQVDHPVLQRPFLCVHPCRTADVLGACAALRRPPDGGAGASAAPRSPRCTVLELWLSLFGPVVGLYLDRQTMAGAVK